MSQVISSAVFPPTMSNLTLLPMILIQCCIECQHPVQKLKLTKPSMLLNIFINCHNAHSFDYKSGCDSSLSETFYSFLFTASNFWWLAMTLPCLPDFLPFLSLPLTTIKLFFLLIPSTASLSTYMSTREYCATREIIWRSWMNVHITSSISKFPLYSDWSPPYKIR